MFPIFFYIFASLKVLNNKGKALIKFQGYNRTNKELKVQIRRYARFGI